MTISWTDDDKLTEDEALALRRYFEALELDDMTQEQIAAYFDISQTFVSRVLNKKGDLPTYRPTRGKVIRMASFAAAQGVTFTDLTGGTNTAGRFEEVDDVKPRGRAMDVLNPLYGEAFLRALVKKTPPPGSANWTPEEWHNHFVELRKLWRSGYLDVPGLPSPMALKKSRS